MRTRIRTSADAKLAAEAGVLFCDADICFFAPLPLIPGGTVLGLSPHRIRPADERRYGAFNGGFLWMSDASLVGVWRQACVTDPRFFEQACLETVASEVARVAGPIAVHEFPVTQNYGWWRMWQGTESPQTLAAAWTMNRRKMESASGILVEGEPLGSIHTHFKGPGAADATTQRFNAFVVDWLRRLGPAHTPARRLLGLIASA
jgi:hypothetical protein